MSSDGARPAGGGFTERVRQELARFEVADRVVERAELAALLRLGGALHLHPGAPEAERLTLEVTTVSGAVARRTHALLDRVYALRPELRVRAPGGVRRVSTYVVVVASAAEDLARDVGMLDAAGRPSGDVPDPLVSGAAAVGFLRGALLAAGSVSAPGRPAHLEIATGSGPLTERVAGLVRDVAGGTVNADDGDRPRVVVKSAETIATILDVAGAHGALAAWDEQRRRRALRNEANRLANADAANVRRTIDAAAAQTRAVADVLDRVGWDALGPDLREVALARLANPTASLAELGELCEPPVGKSSVHRRLRRILALAQDD